MPMKAVMLDDWEHLAEETADWTAVRAGAELVFRHEPFASEDEAARWLADFGMVLTLRERTPFPASLVARLPRLRMFNITGHPPRLIDTKALHAAKVVVCTTDGGDSGATTAEMALGLMLAAARSIPAGDAALHNGGYHEGARAGFVLSGKNLGLVGLGRIGALVAGYANALGMRVRAWSPHLTAERAAAAGAQYVAKEELFSTSDVVSLHLVLSESTRGIVTAQDLSRLKPGALLVNTARALLVDQAAMLAAIRAGRLAAALDVYDEEPLPADHPLRSLPNTVLTPHLGYTAREVLRTYYVQTAENAAAFLAGKPVRVLSP